MDSKTKKIK